MKRKGLGKNTGFMSAFFKAQIVVKPTFLLAISPTIQTKDIFRGIIYIVMSLSSLKKGFVVTTQEQQLLYRNTCIGRNNMSLTLYLVIIKTNTNNQQARNSPVSAKSKGKYMFNLSQ